MKRITRADLARWACLVAAVGLVLLAALWTAQQTRASFLAHSAYDSYAKQAMAWRDGRIALDRDYPWLELAIFQGRYYVSFPPVPAIPMWVLSFFCGENTPSGLMVLLYMLGGIAALHCLLRRYLPQWQAMFLSVFVALGGSLLDITVSGEGFCGGVWYQAQLLGFLFTALSFLLLDGRRRVGWGAGLVCIALAVGCRPFNAVYVPVLLWMLYRKMPPRDGLARTLWAMVPYVIVPGLIAVAYGVYNYARFGNPLEFGHAYLPELAQAGEPMFVPGRIWTNVLNILRMPVIIQGRIYFPYASGFAVYLTNPLLWLAAVRTVERAIRKQADRTDLLLAVLLLAHLLLLLMHRTNGGWQYGTRYLCDLLPALAYLFARGTRPLRRWETACMGALLVFNMYCTVLFHYL